MVLTELSPVNMNNSLEKEIEMLLDDLESGNF